MISFISLELKILGRVRFNSRNPKKSGSKSKDPIFFSRSDMDQANLGSDQIWADLIRPDPIVRSNPKSIVE